MRKLAALMAPALLLAAPAFAQHADDNPALFQSNADVIKAMREQNEGPQHPAFKIFDNLYYVGTNFVSAYLVPTSDGLILIDGAFAWSVDHLLNGVREMGFDPKDIKYIFVTHWHTDHYDGVPAIQKLNGARVGMTQEDWEDLPQDFGLPQDCRMVMRDGDSVTLGDTTLKFYQTPGHTRGVLSIEYTLYDGGTAYKGFTNGGTGLNFSGVEATQNYIASAKRILAMDGIQVNVPNHESMGDVFTRAERLANRQPGDPHPFVAPDDFKSFIQMLITGAEQKLEKEKAREQRRQRRRE